MYAKLFERLKKKKIFHSYGKRGPLALSCGRGCEIGFTPVSKGGVCEQVIQDGV